MSVKIEQVNYIHVDGYDPIIIPQNTILDQIHCDLWVDICKYNSPKHKYAVGLKDSIYIGYEQCNITTDNLEDFIAQHNKYDGVYALCDISFLCDLYEQMVYADMNSESVFMYNGCYTDMFMSSCAPGTFTCFYHTLHDVLDYQEISLGPCRNKNINYSIYLKL